MKNKLGIILILFLLGGCAPKRITCPPMSLMNDTQLTMVLNETTKTEVLDMFGEPHDKKIIHVGEQWIYHYTEKDLTCLCGKRKNSDIFDPRAFHIYFNNENKVTYFECKNL